MIFWRGICAPEPSDIILIQSVCGQIEQSSVTICSMSAVVRPGTFVVALVMADISPATKLSDLPKILTLVSGGVGFISAVSSIDLVSVLFAMLLYICFWFHRADCVFKTNAILFFLLPEVLKNAIFSLSLECLN